jgi:hypothetical protein
VKNTADFAVAGRHLPLVHDRHHHLRHLVRVRDRARHPGEVRREAGLTRVVEDPFALGTPDAGGRLSSSPASSTE